MYIYIYILFFMDTYFYIYTYIFYIYIYIYVYIYLYTYIIYLIIQSFNSFIVLLFSCFIEEWTEYKVLSVLSSSCLGAPTCRDMMLCWLTDSAVLFSLHLRLIQRPPHTLPQTRHHDTTTPRQYHSTCIIYIYIYIYIYI